MAPKKVTCSSSAGTSNNPHPPQGANQPPPQQQQGVTEVVAGHPHVQGAVVAELPIEVGLIKLSCRTLKVSMLTIVLT